MNLFLALMFFCSLDAFFLKDSPDLLVRVVPDHNIADCDRLGAEECQPDCWHLCCL